MSTVSAPGPDLRDPRALRALAHPTRLALLEALATVPMATATQCAELIGESVQSCSFHLRTLARYGFIEPMPGTGREKPWRLVRPSQSIPRDDLDPEQQGAVDTLAHVFIEREFDRLRAWRSVAQSDPTWQRACAMYGTSAWLTADELTRLFADLRALADRYKDRMDDPTSRPSDARNIRIFLATSRDLTVDDGSEGVRPRSLS